MPALDRGAKWPQGGTIDCSRYNWLNLWL